ncbi:MAG: hypothetical protein HZB65_05245 [Candidatus Aenigmarchaeota archaeon]|nr:hypothetical protein [Candidatus Aenigmarchaeota archaeon]
MDEIRETRLKIYRNEEKKLREQYEKNEISREVYETELDGLQHELGLKWCVG